MNDASAFVSNAGSIECILLAVDNILAFAQTGIAIVVSGSGRSCYPNTGIKLTVCETVYKVCAGLRYFVRYTLTINTFIRGLVKIILILTNILPAAAKSATNGKIILAVHFEQAGACFINMTTGHIGANKLAVHEFISMSVSDSGDGCTPVNNGATNIAVGTTGVAGFGSSCFSILKSRYCVFVPRAIDLITCQLGCNIDAAAEGSSRCICVEDRTAYCSYINKYFRFAVCIEALCSCHVFSGCTITANICAFIKRPNADRNAYKCLLAGLRSFTDASYSNSCNLRNFIVGIRCLKAGSCNHMIKFPIVCCLESEFCCYVADRCNIFCNYICIINRITLGNIIQIIVTCQINLRGCACTINCKILCKCCIVSDSVGNFELNAVQTIGENNIFNTHRVAFCMSAGNLYTINIDRCGCVVKAFGVGCGIVSNICVESYDIRRNSLTVKPNVRISCTERRIADNGSITVIYGGTVIECNIIIVERHNLRSAGLDIHTNKHGRISIFKPWILKLCRQGLLINCTCNIYPAVFGNICFCALREAYNFFLMLRIEGKEAITVVGLAILLLHRVRELKRHSACSIFCGVAEALRYIYPHTDVECRFAVCNVTQHSVLNIHAVKVAIYPRVKLNITEIVVYTKSIVTVVNFTTIFSAGNKCIR